jgi:flagellar protein FlaG
MDINTNTLQQQPAVITPLKVVNTKSSVESSVSVKGAGDASSKVETPLKSSGATSVAEAKDTKNPDDLQQAVSKLNDYVQNMQRDLQFSIDKESGTMVIKVIDTQSEKVIRQIPTEETLRLARNLAAQEHDAAFNIFSSRA